VGLTGHSGKDSIGTTELELGIVELGNVLIRDLSIILLGEVTDGSSWRESHEWLCDLSEDLLLYCQNCSFDTSRQTDLEVLPIWVICSTLELDNSLHGEPKLGTVNDLTGALVALDILALVVEDEGLWLLFISCAQRSGAA
jgi:hypothetical protein